MTHVCESESMRPGVEYSYKYSHTFCTSKEVLTGPVLVSLTIPAQFSFKRPSKIYELVRHTELKDIAHKVDIWEQNQIQHARDSQGEREGSQGNRKGAATF